MIPFETCFKSFQENLEEAKRFKSESQIFDLLKFCGFKITITEKNLDAVFTFNGHLIETCYFGIEEKERQTFAELFAQKIIKMVPKKNFRKLDLSAKFLEEVFLIYIKQTDLIQCLPNLTQLIQCPQEFLVKIFKNLKDVDVGQLAIYQTIENKNLKKKLLPYLPSAAIALSDKDLEIRNCAKKTLGLGKNINYRERFRKAVLFQIPKAFPTQFKEVIKKETCKILFNHTKVLNMFSLTWVNYLQKTDVNKIYFNIHISLRDRFGLHGTEYLIPEKFKALPSSITPYKEGPYNAVFSFVKTDYQKVIDEFIPVLIDYLKKYEN